MDLTQSFPRSPKEKIGGLTHVLRMADKARACNNKTLGEYVFPCPLDKMILNFLQITAGEFLRNVIARNERQVVAWLNSAITAIPDDEKDSLNRRILERAPVTREHRDYFLRLRNKVAPTRTDVKTWVDLIDLEEGRI